MDPSYEPKWPPICPHVNHGAVVKVSHGCHLHEGSSHLTVVLMFLGQDWKSAEAVHAWGLQEYTLGSVWLGCPFLSFQSLEVIYLQRILNACYCRLEACHCCSASVSLGICWMFWLSRFHFKYTWIVNGGPSSRFNQQQPKITLLPLCLDSCATTPDMLLDLRWLWSFNDLAYLLLST